MNFKNLVYILRYQFDFKEMFRQMDNCYTYEFRGPNGVDIITMNELKIIKKLQSTELIKEMLCSEKA